MPRNEHTHKGGSKNKKNIPEPMMEDFSDDEDYLFSKESSVDSHPKSSFKNGSMYSNSLVNIFTSAQESDYDFPWLAPKQYRCSGSGFALNYKDRIFIVTNAHVASQSYHMELRLADESVRYKTEVELIDYDCDLAILKVDSEDFIKKIEPLELGEMSHMLQKVQVCGFPMGGNELCITEGKISRIEVSDYIQTETELLQAQVSAAINHGNSGGPVLSGGKVVGVAFQGIDAGEGLGYIIPVPIIRHFLDDVLTPGTYLGFPTLAFKYQKMQSEIMREFYGMSKEQTGIRIRKIDPLSSAKNKLKPDDIVLEIDGYPLKNDGTVVTEFSSRIDFSYVISSKQLGDPISFKVLRDKKIKDLSVILSNRSDTTKLIGQHLYDKLPTYYIMPAGIVLMPLTSNLIEDSTAFFLPSSDDIELMSYEGRPKKHSGEEIVFIKQIFASEFTSGFYDVKNQVITEINGEKIKNLRDAIKAVESNDGKYNVIVTDYKDKIVIPNIGLDKQIELLSKFDIKKDRSDDLLTSPKYRPGCPEFKLSVDSVLSSSSSPFSFRYPLRNRLRDKGLSLNSKKRKRENDDNLESYLPPRKRLKL